MPPFVTIRRNGCSVLLVTWMLACQPAAAGADHAIVDSDAGTITYSQIRCHPRLRNDRVKCRRAEESALHHWVLARAVECAAQMYEIRVPAAKAKEIETKVTAMRPDVSRVAANYRALLRGVMRVQAGEAFENVASDLVKLGMRPHDLEHEISRFENAAATERALQRDHEMAMEKATREGMRRDALVQLLKDRLEERARESGRSLGEAETELWRSSIERCRIRIVDDHYKMPDLKGAFETHVEEFVQTH